MKEDYRIAYNQLQTKRDTTLSGRSHSNSLEDGFCIVNMLFKLLLQNFIWPVIS